MNKELKSLYICICNNEVFCFETNMRAFHKEFTNKASYTKSYSWMNYHFDKGHSFVINFKDVDYYFYKLL